MSLKDIYTRIIPASTIASVLGVGSLPEWRRHWATLVAYFFVATIIGVQSSNHNLFVFKKLSVQQLVLLGAPLFVSAIICYAVGLIAIKLYLVRQSDHHDRVVIDVFSGFLLLFSISLPAINEVKATLALFSQYMCGTYLKCPEWFRDCFTAFWVSLLPFAIYRVIDVLKFWPSRILLTKYESGAFVKIVDTLFTTFYTSSALYLLTIIFFNLKPWEVLVYMTEVIAAGYNQITNIIGSLKQILLGIDITSILSSLGISGILEKIGII